MPLVPHATYILLQSWCEVLAKLCRGGILNPTTIGNIMNLREGGSKGRGKDAVGTMTGTPKGKDIMGNRGTDHLGCEVTVVTMVTMVKHSKH